MLGAANWQRRLKFLFLLVERQEIWICYKWKFRTFTILIYHILFQTTYLNKKVNKLSKTCPNGNCQYCH
jgi:hypothetical protein